MQMKPLTLKQLVCFWEQIKKNEEKMVLLFSDNKLKDLTKIISECFDQLGLKRYIQIECSINNKNNIMIDEEDKLTYNEISLDLSSKIVSKKKINIIIDGMIALIKLQPDFEHFSFVLFKPKPIDDLLEYKTELFDSDFMDLIQYNLDISKLSTQDNIIFDIYLFIDPKIIFDLASVKKEEIKISYNEKGEEKHKLVVFDHLVPTNNIIPDILLITLGKFMLFKKVKDIVIFSNDQHPDMEKLPIYNMMENIYEILSKFETGFSQCAHCNYSIYNTVLIDCDCKKKKYCDNICKSINAEYHKYECKSQSVE